MSTLTWCLFTFVFTAVAVCWLYESVLGIFNDEDDQ